MCYTLEVSRNSFIINLITCYILYRSQNVTHKILALFFAFVGLMQLFDWIFWRNQDMTNTTQRRTNFAVTKVAMMANHLQPIVLAGLIMYYFKHLGILSTIILYMYTVVIIVYTASIYNKIDFTLEDKVPRVFDKYERTSLYWKWNFKTHSGIVYAMFLLCLSILSYENFTFPLNITLLFINVGSFVLSGFLYKGYDIGRFWCNIASYVPLMFLLVNI